MEKLEKNNMHAILLERKEMVLPYLKERIKEGNTVSLGGSMTLEECGATTWLESLPCFIDRKKDQGKALMADYFLSSTNALTEDGELYNVDGRGNRVAPMIFGPKQVILVVGKNKIVSDLEAAVRRVKTVAAPANVQRLHKENTFCYSHGFCAHMEHLAPAGCEGPICSSFVVLGKQLVKDRITVVIVDEELGF